MERGAKLVVITPEYGPPATKADYWIPIRPGVSDTALFLAVTKILIDKKLYDAKFVKSFTQYKWAKAFLTGSMERCLIVHSTCL